MLFWEFKKEVPKNPQDKYQEPSYYVFTCCRAISLICKKFNRERYKAEIDQVVFWHNLETVNKDTYLIKFFSFCTKFSILYFPEVFSFTFSFLLQSTGGQDAPPACEAPVTLIKSFVWMKAEVINGMVQLKIYDWGCIDDPCQYIWLRASTSSHGIYVNLETISLFHCISIILISPFCNLTSYIFSYHV